MHDDAHAPTHEEHTGHGAHHVLGRDTLLKTFGALVALTVLTVALALLERAGVIPLGGLSVPVALGIAGAKASLVAAYFMGLKYDGGTNLLAFVGGVAFLVIFLTFTYLDTGFRDTFDEQSAVPVDILRAEEAALLARQDSLLRTATPPPLVSLPDTALFPNAPMTPPVVTTPAAPAPAPAPQE
ncbi:MAG TPA: cytochrome C oxidase subunit IV family protein [Rubricoccaceae bacterium]|nr:cytochrome C oxidase subunit IV family protein [Rubricoccaceae bacterium]